ncbi:chloride channel protein [Hyphomicrobiales bacterium]|jgi:CIC family chloride channel protein|nr:chloride channel protein [Rhodobiaceae bacterium]MBT6222844.1 chloride channel protein [Rhodobiaceae bacterium]MDC0139191.1 chloride channel protein [Hyphomicrobiales bacterium]
MKQLFKEILPEIRGNLYTNWRSFKERKTPIIWVLAILIGALSSIVSIIFRYLINCVQFLWIGSSSEQNTEILNNSPFWILFLGPVIGGLFVGIIIQYISKIERPYNIADVIEARSIKKGYISLKEAIGSAVISFISLGSGASAGREGPIVHLGAAIGSYISRRFNLPTNATRTLLACGVAAAISASFNAPIAGVLFALEIILGHYALTAFVPIVISSVIAALLSRLHFGDFPAFIIPDYTIVSLYEFPAFALLGVICALIAVIFQISIITSIKISSSLKIRLWLRPVIGGFLIGIIGIFVPEILGVGYASTDDALRQQLSLDILIILIIAKIIATAITFSSRFGGGIFSPSLFIGAMTGASFGIIAGTIFPDQASANGLYALIGMGGVAAAVLGAPISTILIVFELTGGYDIALALILTISISSGLSQAILKRNIFHQQLEARGLNISDGIHKNLLYTIKTKDFIKNDSSSNISNNIKNDLYLLEEDNLEKILSMFKASKLSELQIIDKNNKDKIIGTLSYVDVLHYYNEKLIENSKEEHS